jgi:NADH-quinone oxidoreductase subunit L
MKAFVVNRIGDFGFLCGIFLIFWAMADAGHASVSFPTLKAQIGVIAERSVAVPGWLPGPTEWKLTTLIGLALFVGAVGKSAQIPLYTWLPDAMAGPTPVSALIHAATMVTAGVYNSTISQLGYMFLAAGCGAYTAAMFHVTTHAFFKALLFLASGSVILAMHHEQDTDKMGGLRKRLPLTHGVFLVGVLAIAGFPGLSGFFSKDEVLLSAWLAEGVPGHKALYAIGVVTAAITAFYMLRVHARTFWGESRAPREVQAHAREPVATVTYPLVVLAALAIVGGAIGLPQLWGDLIGIPHSNSLANFFHGVVSEPVHHASHATEWALAGAAVGATAVGFLLAYWLYVASPELPVRIREALGPVFRMVRDKYYVDEAYDAVIVRPLVAFSDRVLFRWIDVGLIDGLGADGTAQLVRASAGRVLKYAQSGLTQGYLFSMVVGAAAIIAWLLADR